MTLVWIREQVQEMWKLRTLTHLTYCQGAQKSNERACLIIIIIIINGELYISSIWLTGHMFPTILRDIMFFHLTRSLSQGVFCCHHGLLGIRVFPLGGKFSHAIWPAGISLRLIFQRASISFHFTTTDSKGKSSPTQLVAPTHLTPSLIYSKMFANKPTHALWRLCEHMVLTDACRILRIAGIVER